MSLFVLISLVIGGAPDAALKAAAEALEAGDPRRALELIEPYQPAGERDLGRKLRLEADAYVAQGDRIRAEERFARLEKIDGWQAHVRQQRAHAKNGALKKQIGDAGSFVFALALAWLALMGSRELLRFHRAALLFIPASIGAILVMSLGSPLLAQALGVFSLCVLTLIHATAASMSRLSPGPRFKILLLTSLILGSLGALAAVAARLETAVLG